MATVGEESSDDDLYAWFIDALANEFGAAQEVEPNVVHVWSTVNGVREHRPYELRISRDELRSLNTQESMDSGSRLSRTYEFDGGQMRRVNLH